MTKALRRYGGLIALALALAVRPALGHFSLFEVLFFDTWFPLVKNTQSVLMPLWVLPGYALMLLLFALWLVWRLPRRFRAARSWLRFFRRLLNLFGAALAVFMVLWGYNYVGPTLRSRMHLADRATASDPMQTYTDVMHLADSLRSLLPNAVDTVSIIDFLPPSDDAIAAAVGQVLVPLGYPQVKHVRVRRIVPAGTMRGLGISGIYNPFTGEANVDGVYGALLGTFTVAHEMAHAYGITGEAEANFAAYLALIHMDNPLSAYAAQYALWRYTASTVNKMYSKEALEALVRSIPLGLRTDRHAVMERLSGHRVYFPELSEAVNDTYLKSQGIRAGSADYDLFVNLYLDWKAQGKTGKQNSPQPFVEGS